MTQEQEAHLQRVISEAKIAIEDKYRKGQAEHDGNLFEKTVSELINEAILEAIDQLVYLLTAKDVLDKTKIELSPESQLRESAEGVN